MELTFKVNKPADYVFDILTNMKRFVTVHPVIDKIDDWGNNNYLVHETLKLGFIPYSFTYPVTLDSNYENKTVIIKATVMRLIKIEMTFNLR